MTHKVDKLVLQFQAWMISCAWAMVTSLDVHRRGLFPYKFIRTIYSSLSVILTVWEEVWSRLLGNLDHWGENSMV